MWQKNTLIKHLFAVINAMMSQWYTKTRNARCGGNVLLVWKNNVIFMLEDIVYKAYLGGLTWTATQTVYR